jgi:outer membrane murein-binding lipoprotein Lpp
MATLTVLWSALGLAMFSIRASHPLTTSALGTDATGALAGPSGGTSSGSSGLPLAIVLLIVYLLTGAVAMTHGYRTGDPAADALRKLLHRRARLIRDLERARHDLTVARGQSRRATQNLDNEEQLHRAEKDTLERVGEEVTADGKHRVAMHQADPSRTDGLFHPDAEQQAG